MNKKNGGTINLTQKKSYSRYFIILQEDEKGYSQAQDKLCSGYAKLEMKNDKCKISYYVQNLKREPVPYYMILICNKKEVKKLIKIGEMNIDDNGHTEVSFEYPVDNIAGSGIAMDKVSGASIVKFINTEIVSIMSGFATTDIPEWKSFVLVEELKRSEEEKLQEEKPEDKSIFDKYEEKVVETKTVNEASRASVVDTTPKPQPPKAEINRRVESKQEIPASTITVEENKAGLSKVEASNVDDSHRNNISKKVEEVKKENIVEGSPKLEEGGSEESEARKSDHKHEKKEKECKEKEEYKVEEKIEELKEYKEEKKIKEEKEYKEYHKEDYPKGAVGDFFKMLVEGFEEMFDVCDEIKRCRWFRVPVNSVHDMTNVSDYNRYTVVYYPMNNYFNYIKKYGHFLMGYKCDKSGNMKYLVYAIPGIKSKMEQPFEGKSGFVTWVPLRDGEDNEDSFGYWLMFYDFRTSTIIIPVK